MGCPGRQDVSISECKAETLQEIYKALNWQGGTIWQVIEEIKRLKNYEEEIKLKSKKSCMKNF